MPITDEYMKQMITKTKELPIACPINDGTEIKGIGIFTTSAEETRRIMDEDSGVKAGIFTYEVHPCRSFPEAMLP